MPETTRAWIRLLLSRLAAALFGLMLALAVAEVGLRLVAPGRADYRLPLTYSHAMLDRVAAGRSYVMFDAWLGWVSTPDVNVRSDGDERYRNNRAGMRAEREYEQSPRPGVRRLSAYGDSFTYCIDVQIDDCWTDKLADALRRTEVLNFGVPGYAADQAWLRYQRDGSSWQPCAVLIGHMTENINRIVNRFRPFYYPFRGDIPLSKPRFILADGKLSLLPNPASRVDELKDPLWVETHLGPRDSWFVPYTFVAHPLDGLSTFNLARSFLYHAQHDEGMDWTPGWAERVYRPGSESFELLVAVLEGFATQVRADGATPIVLIFPTREEVVALLDQRRKPHATLLELLAERGIAVVDLTDGLAREAQVSGVDGVIRHHLKANGNAVVTRVLERQIPRLAAATCQY